MLDVNAEFLFRCVTPDTDAVRMSGNRGCRRQLKKWAGLGCGIVVERVMNVINSQPSVANNKLTQNDGQKYDSCNRSEPSLIVVSSLTQTVEVFLTFFVICFQTSEPGSGINCHGHKVNAFFIFQTWFTNSPIDKWTL